VLRRGALILLPRVWPLPHLPTLVWGTSASDIWTATSYESAAVFFIQAFNGTTTSAVTTGFDTSTSVISPTALWVGPHDVYLGTAKGITLRMTR
jgi:hypothetical protein